MGTLFGVKSSNTLFGLVGKPMEKYHVYVIEFDSGYFYYGRHKGQLKLNESRNSSIFAKEYTGSGGALFESLKATDQYVMKIVDSFDDGTSACLHERMYIQTFINNSLCLNENVPSCTALSSLLDE